MKVIIDRIILYFREFNLFIIKRTVFLPKELLLIS